MTCTKASNERRRKWKNPQSVYKVSKSSSPRIVWTKQWGSLRLLLVDYAARKYHSVRLQNETGISWLHKDATYKPEWDKY
jgi:hypothetical protein